MSDLLTLETLAQTVEHQAAELVRLNERVEDLEDLHELQDAIMRNAGRPLHSWEEAQEKLGLTDEEVALPTGESRKDGQAAGY